MKPLPSWLLFALGSAFFAGLTAILGKLITLDKKVKANSGKMKLCCIRPEIFEVFKITKLDRLFDIKKDEAEALATF